MTNTVITSDIVLREALLHLENELVISKICNRDYEAPFAKPQKAGDTIRIRRPVRGVVRTGSTMQVQDVFEGRTTLAIANQIGADLEFSSTDLTLRVEQFSENILRPQMIKLANKIDQDVMTELVTHCPNWQGTPGNTVSSFAAYARGPQRLDELAVPTNDRGGILGPADYWGAVGSLTALSADAPVKSALQRSSLGRYANTDTYMSQNVVSLTVGTWQAATPVINGNGQATTYAAVAASDYLSQTLNIRGLTANTSTFAVGDVFTISTAFAVNPITLAVQPFLRQFTVLTAGTADANGNASLTITPAIIPTSSTVPPASGSQYATVSIVPTDGLTITVKGTSNTAYPQNVVLHPDAVTLAVIPMIRPEGAVKCETQTYKGISMRLITGYDITNDLTPWRFDILYGTRAIQPNLACRLSG